MKALLRKLGWIMRRPRKEAELREELEFHLAEEAEERKAIGLSEEQARFAARRDLGSVALIAEDTDSHGDGSGSSASGRTCDTPDA